MKKSLSVEVWVEERRSAGEGAVEREGSNSMGAVVGEAVGVGGRVGDGEGSGFCWSGAAGWEEEGEVAEGGGWLLESKKYWL